MVYSNIYTASVKMAVADVKCVRFLIASEISAGFSCGCRGPLRSAKQSLLFVISLLENIR